LRGSEDIESSINHFRLNQHKSTSQESVKTISSKDQRAEQVDKEIVVYTEEDHLKKGNPEIQEII
jgi:hypothetical protein